MNWIGLQYSIESFYLIDTMNFITTLWYYNLVKYIFMDFVN